MAWFAGKARSRRERRSYRRIGLDRFLNGCYCWSCLQGLEDTGMGTKFSEDVIPLTDLKVNPGRVVKHAADAHRPVLLTSRGRGVAVVQSMRDYETAEEERAFMRAVVAGLADLEAGRELSLAQAKARLGLK